jgi:hypothetical protein
MSNNSQIAFNLLGKTIVVPAAATAPSGVQLHELLKMVKLSATLSIAMS